MIFVHLGGLESLLSFPHTFVQMRILISDLDFAQCVNQLSFSRTQLVHKRWILSYVSILLIEILILLFHGAIPVVFNRVVGPADNVLRDVCPSISQQLMRQVQQPLLLLVPLVLFNVRIKVVMPSLSALFSDTTVQVL